MEFFQPPTINDVRGQLEEQCQEDGSDDEEDTTTPHPNKYAVEIETHHCNTCQYKRQPTRYGLNSPHYLAVDPVDLKPSHDNPMIEGISPKRRQKAPHCITRWVGVGAGVNENLKPFYRVKR